MHSDQATDLLAFVILLVLALALVAWALRWYRRETHYTLAQAPFWLLNLIYTRVAWRTTISGPLPVAENQGAVIVCNHSSSLDPSFIQLATNRVVHWMVAREYCLHWAMAWIFRIVESIPVNRGGVDTAATKMAIRYAQEGGLVGIFPEGQINHSDQVLLPGRPGAALIALKARVPVIPCYVSGAPYDGTEFGCLLMTAKTHLEVGQPIDISEYYERDDEKEVLELLTKRFLIEIARLAGATDFVPRLAGRHWKPLRAEEPEHVAPSSTRR